MSSHRVTAEEVNTWLIEKKNTLFKAKPDVVIVDLGRWVEVPGGSIFKAVSYIDVMPWYILTKIIYPADVGNKLITYDNTYNFVSVNGLVKHDDRVLLSSIEDLKRGLLFEEIPYVEPDLKKYPNKCRDCSNPAYVGFTHIECSNFMCKRYKV